MRTLTLLLAAMVCVSCAQNIEPEVKQGPTAQYIPSATDTDQAGVQNPYIENSVTVENHPGTAADRMAARQGLIKSVTHGADKIEDVTAGHAQAGITISLTSTIGSTAGTQTADATATGTGTLTASQQADTSATQDVRATVTPTIQLAIQPGGVAEIQVAATGEGGTTADQVTGDKDLRTAVADLQGQLNSQAGVLDALLRHLNVSSNGIQ